MINLIWFRNDLRVHDNAILNQAIANNPQQIIPIYCFDERLFKTTSFGFPKTGKFRAKFLLESIANLRQSLQQIGSNLVVKIGIPEDIINNIAREYQVDTVYFSQEATAEEIKVEKVLINRLNQANIQVKSIWQSTLYHPEDLPFNIENIPDLFTNFRKQIEQKNITISCLKTPDNLPPIPNINIGEIPSLKDLGLSEFTPHPQAVLNFRGGEAEAIKRLNDYFWEKDCLKDYKNTRNQMLGSDYSSTGLFHSKNFYKFI